MREREKRKRERERERERDGAEQQTEPGRWQPRDRLAERPRGTQWVSVLMKAEIVRNCVEIERIGLLWLAWMPSYGHELVQ